MHTLLKKTETGGEIRGMAYIRRKSRQETCPGPADRKDPDRLTPENPRSRKAE